ncbi:capsular polysaccharide biosynthesis protein [Prosthecochloris vibrioformis]|uniref:Capsular polysaccharide biosynthesis protein n=1 Tax=Prosthecochloris vibrioformis TaxID=1098 RepID=A0A5C4RZV2_PROVB|nr:capsular polysaccharide biosynthesis protein [Prosthecochloris vibrioformis]TNJ36257.1 capsular polysaccharide biosynthesis protein [Prosthecochloris vibrioformis]
MLHEVRQPGGCIGVLSRGIMKIPLLEQLVGSSIAFIPGSSEKRVDAIAGWGLKPTTKRAVQYARTKGLPYVSFEDGFLRSYGTGDLFPPLSVVVDDVGIYYDSTRPSALEQLLNSDKDLLEGIAIEVKRAKELMLTHNLSKYNHAPMSDGSFLRSSDRGRVLVVDQTAGDMSVGLGGGNEHTFAAMLEAARRENPEATVYVKTHPEVSAGRKGGYLTRVQDDERTVVLRDALNPMSLIQEMDSVYVVSSTMGFEALLAGKPVSCFGVPWYAGWGVTDDRQACTRRVARRSVDELFAAAYVHYARYLDPVTHERGTILDVIGWLVLQREMAACYPGRMIGIGFRRWKALNVGPMLSLHLGTVQFAGNGGKVRELLPGAQDHLVVWGRGGSAELEMLSGSSGAALLRMEDGFVRSVGLGSDLIRPMSLVLDSRGIYFDPSRSSDLEQLLLVRRFSDEELERARAVRQFIVQHGITKYNTEAREAASWDSEGRRVVLVPGQVEDDASIQLGCGAVRTNAGLLRAVRQALPDAFLVYKPHPDVLSGNRAGMVALEEARRWADHVEVGLSVVSCIDGCDEVHTMTSLTGFDALLRGKRVVTYGQPFYAGWGLTDDRMLTGTALRRRQDRVLGLDELVAGTLLCYPLYWDWELKGYTTCEAVLRRIVEQRSALEASGGLHKLRVGYWRRQRRKLGILLAAWVR